MKVIINLTGLILIIVSFLGTSCNPDDTDKQHPNVDRETKIPGDVVKGTPANDDHPPMLHSAEFEAPEPLPYPFSTAGAEDSPFILPDGNTLFFFFTPDVRIDVTKQLLDSVTGIWVSEKVAGVWKKPYRLWLTEPGKLALDGAVCVQGNEMWFASAREGFEGVNMFTAEKNSGKWQSWTYSGDRLMKEIQIGEVHLHGDSLYFHSGRTGGKGSFDIWVTVRSGSTWNDPQPIDSVNTTEMDGYPYISSDGSEMWFTRTYMGTPAVFRSKKVNGLWRQGEMIVSQFAGEPSLDDEGNLYFVHHYYKNNMMIEADIYVAYRKK